MYKKCDVRAKLFFFAFLPFSLPSPSSLLNSLLSANYGSWTYIVKVLQTGTNNKQDIAIEKLENLLREDLSPGHIVRKPEVYLFS